MNAPSGLALLPAFAALVAAAALQPVRARAQCAPLVPGTGYAASCSGTGVGDTCSVFCAVGHAGTATPSFSACQANGTWSATAFVGCAPVSCGTPAAPPGYALSCTGTTYGETCAFSCDGAQGYLGVPSATSSACQANTEWSPDPASLSGCALASCGAPGDLHAGYAYTCSGTSFGDTCSIVCATGWAGLPVIAATTCQLEGWSPLPSTNAGCELVDCGPLVLDGADVADCTAHSRYLEACTVTCLAGRSGSPAATCAAAGTWSVTGACDPIPCYGAPATNGASCGGAGETCLSGACALPAGGQLCALPFGIALGVEHAFPLDDHHDLLAATRCPGDLAAGKDVFLGVPVTPGRFRLTAEADAAAGLDALVLGSCAATACAPLDAQAAATTLVATLDATAAGTLTVAVHARGAPAGSTLRVTVAPVPAGAAGGAADGGCGCAGGPASPLGLWAVLALALRPRRRGEAHPPRVATRNRRRNGKSVVPSSRRG